MSIEGSPRSAGGRQPHLSALIIAGAAGKGPFAAGVLSRLARDERFDIRCLMGASSGALNAAVYAAGLRVGEAAEAADHLCELWRKQSHWHRIWTHGQRVAIVRKALERFAGKTCKRDVKLEVAVASLQGKFDEKFQHLRYEHSYLFDTAAFQTASGIADIAEVCVLSSTIPLLFPPREFKRDGQFWDGGVVNNTPIGHALKMDRSIDHMIIVTPDSELVESKRYGRFSIWRLLELVLEERLARDLCEAKSFNEELAALCRAGIDLEQLAPEVKWKLLQFVDIRPAKDLPGSLLTGFLRSKRRVEYVDIGQQTACERLSSWQPEVFDTSPSAHHVEIGAASRGATSVELSAARAPSPS